MEFLAPLLAALRPVVTAEAVKILDEVAAKAASGAEEDIRQAERDLLAWLARRDCGHGDDTWLRDQLNRIERKVDHMSEQQTELDADVQALSGVLSSIQTAEQANASAVTAVQAEIAALQAAQGSGQPLDLSGLEALINGSPDGSTPGLVQAAQSVTDGVAAVQGLVPAAPVSDGSSNSGDGSVSN